MLEQCYDCVSVTYLLLVKNRKFQTWWQEDIASFVSMHEKHFDHLLVVIYAIVISTLQNVKVKYKRINE